VNNQKPDERDDALSKVLKEWRVDNSLPPGFQQSVWRKIDQQISTPTSHASIIQSIRAWLDGVATRPRLAASYLAALILVGVSVGWTQGHRDNTRAQNELAERYVRSLDPYLAPRS